MNQNKTDVRSIVLNVNSDQTSFTSDYALFIFNNTNNWESRIEEAVHFLSLWSDEFSIQSIQLPGPPPEHEQLHAIIFARI